MRSFRPTVILLVCFLILGQVPSSLAQPLRTRSFETIFTSVYRALAIEDKISEQALEDTASVEKASLVILLADQADVSDAYDIADHDARGWYVYRALTEHANRTQVSVKRLLAERDVEYESYWIANMIVAKLDRDLAVEIAGRSDVARVDSNRNAKWIDPAAEVKTDDLSNRSDSVQAIEWGVANVNAPALWSMGINGNGIVVGGLDTGIRWTHNAIKSKYRGWNGTTADHNYNWHDAVHTGGGVCGANTTEPCDDNNHGSHTLGTMVGDDGSGNQIGVAPGAKWIGCRNMNVGNGSPATYSECFQFMLAPTDLAGNNANPSLRPHILNNSWGCPAIEGCTTRAELEAIVNNLHAAGIFIQSSAGNLGAGGCSTVSEAIAIYDATFSAGAIDSSNNLAGLSSRGPSTYYSPNILKPNLVAPGIGIRSIGRASDTTYNVSSGTSMASPHVAGVVALLWSARPELVRNIAATKALLQNTSNPNVNAASQTCGGTPTTVIPNNIFGYGRVDALAAYNASASPTVQVTGRVVTPDLQPLRNVVVTLIDSAGVRRNATTSSFGIYTFEGVDPNEDYTLTVVSKRYRFSPLMVAIGTSNFTAADLVGLQ